MSHNHRHTVLIVDTDDVRVRAVVDMLEHLGEAIILTVIPVEDCNGTHPEHLEMNKAIVKALRDHANEIEREG